MHDDLQVTPLAIRPTRLTLYLRRSLLWQLWRFIVINLRMTVMIVKSHHTRLPHGKHVESAPVASVVKPS